MNTRYVGDSSSETYSHSIDMIIIFIIMYINKTAWFIKRNAVVTSIGYISC
jgi:hypothetical protein